MQEKLKRLLTPEGVWDLLPDMARQKRKLEEKIQELFSRWGYQEVSTPAFEYSANFVGEMKDGLAEQLYRLWDERGRTLVLRPDFTIPLARVAALHLTQAPQPLRLCYGGSIFRQTAGLQGKQRELTQAGVELLGSPHAAADAEVIALAAAVLQAAGLEEFTLCLGHSGFLDSLLSAYQVDLAERAIIKRLFYQRDFVTLKKQVNRLPLADRQKENILRIPTLRGGREVLEEARELLTTEQADRPLATLAEIWSVLEDYGATAFLQFDLGLVRMLDYYTVMVFEGYTAGLGYALCGGGRYDRLLEHFGPARPAVGFAVSIDHLLTLLTREKKMPALTPPVYVAYGRGGRAAAIAAAQALRTGQTPAILAAAAATAAEARRQAAVRGAQRLLYYSEAGVLDLDLQKAAGEEELDG